MIRASGKRRGFTLVELMVVIAMIALIMGAMASAVTSAQERSREQKALSEVKVISQAVLAYENWDRGSGRYELPTLTEADCDRSNLSFLIGEGEGAKSGGTIPAQLIAQLQRGAMRDPWGTPYRITIRKGGANVKMQSATGTLRTGFYLPNYYHLTEAERR